MFAMQSKGATDRYFACRSRWIKKETAYATELKRLNDELQAVTNKVNALTKKASAYFDGKPVPKVVSDVPSISSDMDLGIQFASVQEQARVILDKIDEVNEKDDACLLYTSI